MPDIVSNPVEYAREIVGKDPFATFLGIEVDEVRTAYARCSVTVKPEFMNAMERGHGALIHALADQAFAVACNSRGVMALALNFYINYISATTDGEKLFSEAMPVSIGKKVSVWKIEVRGSGDRLIASCTGTAYHK